MKPEKFALRLSREKAAQCIKFADDVASTNEKKYAERGQTNRELIRAQNINGKLAEEVVYNAYSPYYPGISLPDYQIYDKREKSYREDLIDSNSDIKIAVKSKDIKWAQQYGESWIFGTKDKKSFGKEIDPNQYVCCVVIDRAQLRGIILACVKLKWIHENNLFEAPDRASDERIALRYDSMLKVVRDES